MINAVLSDSYLRPHKHENPDKLEIFSILKGVAAILIFDDSGKIIECVKLEENGKTKIVETPPRTWHTFVVLSPEAVLYEIIEGKYNANTNKKFASWAPDEENLEEAKKYLNKLKIEINQIL
jgi:cupin fold WbuC family metalloprotein